MDGLTQKGKQKGTSKPRTAAEQDCERGRRVGLSRTLLITLLSHAIHGRPRFPIQGILLSGLLLITTDYY